MNAARNMIASYRRAKVRIQNAGVQRYFPRKKKWKSEFLSVISARSFQQRTVRSYTSVTLPILLELTTVSLILPRAYSGERSDASLARHEPTSDDELGDVKDIKPKARLGLRPPNHSQLETFYEAENHDRTRARADAIHLPALLRPPSFPRKMEKMADVAHPRRLCSKGWSEVRALKGSSRRFRGPIR
jgi:hypothetical protein